MAYSDAPLAGGYFLRLGVDVYSQSVALNTTTYYYTLVIYKGSGSGKYASGTAYWSLGATGYSNFAGGAIGGYDFRGYSALTLANGLVTMAGSPTKSWAGAFTDIPGYGELGSTQANIWNLTPPSIPLTQTSLSVVRVSDGQQTLSWANGNVYSGVVVQRSADAGAWLEVGRPAGNVTTFTDTTTEGDHRYEYRVAGLGGAGQSAWSNTAAIYTAPAAPTGVTAARAGAMDIVVSAASVPAIATAFDIDDNGTVIASGVTLPWTHVSPNPAVPHTYKVRGSVAGVKGVFSSPSNTVQLIAAPNAPTNLTPNGGVAASDGPVRLGFTHNPVDSSAQTAYELRHRAPSGAWTTLSGTTAAYRDVTLPVGDRQWEVRTKGAHANWSPWSATATVTVIGRPGVAVTQPDATWEASILEVAWSWFQAQGRPQSSWEAELLDEIGSVVEARSGSGATAGLTFNRRLSEGEWTVRIRAATGAVWSGWAAESFSVVFNPPTLPTLSGEWDETAGGVSLELNAGSDDAAPTTVRMMLERSIDGGNAWELMQNTTEPALILMDWESLSHGTTRYRVTAFTLEGATSETVVSVLAASKAIWLSAGRGFEVTGRLPFDPKVAINAGRARALKRYAGRSLPVAYAGEALTRTVQVSGTATDHALSGEQSADVASLTRIAQASSPVFLYRDPDGRRIAGVIGEIQMPRDTAAAHESGWNGLWGYSFTLEESGR